MIENGAHTACNAEGYNLADRDTRRPTRSLFTGRKLWGTIGQCYLLEIAPEHYLKHTRTQKPRDYTVLITLPEPYTLPPTQFIAIENAASTT